MTTLNETYVNSLKINRLTKTQLNNAAELSPSEAYWEDPEFVGGKLLETTSDGDIVESSQTIPTKTSDITNDSGFITGITSAMVTTALGYSPVNPTSLATVATSGAYSDLSGKPTIPTVNNPTITITQGGVTKGSFTLNQSTGDTIALDAGGGGSLPSQTGQSGKFLTTDGTDASWGLPKTHNLFDFIWRDAELNDQSWLRADTFSWQDGTVYTEAYNHLVADYSGGTSQTETVGSYTITYVLATDGHKITTDETNVANIYNESGVAWYYILDTANQRFKLPRTKYGFVGLRDSVGKYVEAGLPNITGIFRGAANSDATVRQGGAFSGIDGTAQRANGGSNANSVEYSFDASSSNSIYGNSTTVQPPATQMYLYFYVGQFSQSATEQTAGLNSSLFNGKADVDLGNAVSNASTSSKESIVGWGMPDYSSGIESTITSSTTYTAPSHGFVCMTHNNSSTRISFIINGVNVCTQDKLYSDGQYLVSKGDVLKVNTSSMEIIFFPLKGV